MSEAVEPVVRDGEMYPYVEDLRPGLFVRPLSLVRENDQQDELRTISDARFEDLKYALDNDSRMLNARPLIGIPDGQLVAGNMRHRALTALGRESAPVFIEDLDEATQREWMARDNADYGDWVPEGVAALVAAHSEDEGDMALLGFSDTQTEALLKTYRDEPENGGGGSGGGGGASAEVWGIVIECETEEEQSGLLDELAERGLEVRALLPT